eukprot:TRINITY_DN6954_c0_g1_i1.p2 TRINITY_DN6954_c0_g1~~TRINITY_DN6954_c0_g1_i1.p2  ORF type:complete len:181 (+),score=55.49 TRINITY_DN6954_c0_g1_i1:46-588(+)
MAKAKAEIPAEVSEFLAEHEDFEVITFGDKVKVKCVLTSHEMLPVLATLETYRKGKKYQAALEGLELGQEKFAQFAPYIESHAYDPTKLFCNLTGREFPRSLELVQRHWNSTEMIKMVARAKVDPSFLVGKREERKLAGSSRRRAKWKKERPRKRGREEAAGSKEKDSEGGHKRRRKVEG